MGLIGFGSGGRGALIGDYSEGRLERSEEKSRFLHHLCVYSPVLTFLGYTTLRATNYFPQLTLTKTRTRCHGNP